MWWRPSGLPAGCWSPRGRREGALRGAGRGTGPRPGVAGRQPHCPLRPACCSAFLSRGGPQGLVPTSCPHQMQMLSQLWALGAPHSPVSREVMGNPCQMPRDGGGTASDAGAELSWALWAGLASLPRRQRTQMGGSHPGTCDRRPAGGLSSSGQGHAPSRLSSHPHSLAPDTSPHPACLPPPPSWGALGTIDILTP